MEISIHIHMHLAQIIVYLHSLEVLLALHSHSINVHQFCAVLH